jgi:hypothetical protein
MKIILDSARPTRVTGFSDLIRNTCTTSKELDLMNIRSRPWLAMSGFVSVGSTPQTTDIFACCRHVGNVGPTRWQHSVMSANF